MRLVRTALLVLLATGLGGAAHAQHATGRSGSSSLTYMGREDALDELTAFGRCYAKKKRVAALSLLATRPGSREEFNLYRKLFRGEQGCISSDTSIGAPLPYARGAIAEGLLRSGEGVPASHLLPAPKTADVRNLSDAARCYAADHRSEVESLRATKPGSEAEFKAVSAIAPKLMACMPEGVPLNFDATVVRYRLVEALLRLAPSAHASR